MPKGKFDPTTYERFLECRSDLIPVFRSHIDKQGPDDCWLWTSSTAGGNNSKRKRGGKYGMFWWTDPDLKPLYPNNRRLCYAHVLAHFLDTGRLPGAGMDEEILHLCEDRYPKGDHTHCLCCNPAHLRIGTHSENIRMSSSTKLSEHDVWDIHVLHDRGLTQQAIANHFDVSQVYVGDILRGEWWADVHAKYIAFRQSP